MSGSKKGSILDFIAIPIILIIVGLTLIISLMIVQKIDSAQLFNQTDTPEAQHAMNMTNKTLLNMDNMVLFIFIGLNMFVLISSYLVYNHPVMWIFSVILLGICIFLAANFSNTYEQMITQGGTSSAINQTAQYFPKTNYIMSKLPLYILIMGFMTIVAMYAGYNK